MTATDKTFEMVTLVVRGLPAPEPMTIIDIPFRFFATAIVFVIGLAFFVFCSGESLWLSRWYPSMLALTHGLR